MAEESYAFINGDTVVNTAIFDNPDESLLNVFKEEHSVEKIIKCPAYVYPGFTLSGEDWIRPKPWPSWVFSNEDKDWVSPVPMPEDGPYIWDEETVSWKTI
jgi:hypothetical protein